MEIMKIPDKVPQIVVEPPGPVASKIVKEDREYLSPLTKVSPVAIKRGHGAIIEDVDGNYMVDFTTGIGVTNLGHTHPAVVKAVQEQAARFFHFAGTDYYYEMQVELAKKLTYITPGNYEKKVYLSNSGTESVEAAIKMAKYNTNRHRFISFIGAFHGRTMGSLALCASKDIQKRHFFPFMPGVNHFPFPDTYRTPPGINAKDVGGYVIDMIKDAFDSYLPADDVGAIFVEPIQGEGGYRVPPSDFYTSLKRLTEENGILFVADEVQSGFGRTGKMFAIEHFNVVPDIIAMAKGMGSGLPIGAIVYRKDLDFGPGTHSSTYAGNPVAAASSLATIDVIEKENLLEEGTRKGDYTRKRLMEIMGECDFLGDVRGLGFMLVADFVKSKEKKDYNPEFRDMVIEKAYKKGLILLSCGKSGIRIIPPLNIPMEHLDAGIDVFEKAIKEAQKEI